MSNSIVLKLFSLLMVFTIGGHSYAKGPSNGGGGYKYQDTSLKHLVQAVNLLGVAVYSLNQQDIDAVTSKYTTTVFTKEKLVKYLLGVRFLETDTGEREKGNGTIRIQDMDYSLSHGGYIIALQPFLELFHKAELSPAEKHILQRKIIHEITHLFGVGLEDNDQSTKLSEELMSLLKDQYTECGGYGSVENRIENCKGTDLRSDVWLRGGEIAKRLKTGPLVSSFKTKIANQTVNVQIRDSREVIDLLTSSVQIYLRSVDLKTTAEEVCARLNTLDGLVNWKAMTEIQLKHFQKNSSEPFWSTIALANNRVQYFNSKGFNSEWRFTEMTNSRRIDVNQQFVVKCVGSMN